MVVRPATIKLSGPPEYATVVEWEKTPIASWGMSGMLPRAIITDVDGVLTDGGYYYNSEGLCLKKFNTRDAAAARIWQQRALLWFVLTSASDEITKKRIELMRPDKAYFGVEDKLRVAREICADYELEKHQVVYIGDDFLDVPCLEEFPSFCPVDANLAAMQVANVVTVRAAGEGVLNEVIDGFLLEPPVYWLDNDDVIAKDGKADIQCSGKVLELFPKKQ